MKEVKLPCAYVGADIVEEVISLNQKWHTGPDRQFIVLDAINDPFPTDADVVLCREVLFHLSNLDAGAVIANLKRSRTRYFIATNIDSETDNTDIFTGGYRSLDLRKPPFNFPEPLEMIPDQGVSKLRYLGCWDVADIPTPD